MALHFIRSHVWTFICLEFLRDETLRPEVQIRRDLTQPRWLLNLLSDSIDWVYH